MVHPALPTSFLDGGRSERLALGCPTAGAVECGRGVDAGREAVGREAATRGVA